MTATTASQIGRKQLLVRRLVLSISSHIRLVVQSLFLVLNVALATELISLVTSDIKEDSRLD